MKKKKGLIIVLIILIILLIGGGAFAYVYFATDLLKTNSQLFSKYGKENVNEIVDFFDVETIQSYFERKMANSYENSGDITVSMNDGTNNITGKVALFEGIADISNKNLKQTVSINYSDTEKFNIECVLNNGNFAIASDEVANKYIAIKNENLRELADNLGIDDTERIPDEINVSDYEAILSQDGKQKVKDALQKYVDIISSKLTEADFSKVEGAETSYILTIQNEKLQEVMISVAQELKNESLILDYLSSEDEQTSFEENMEELIEEIEDDDFSDVSLTVNVEKVADGNAYIVISLIDGEETYTTTINKSQYYNKLSINLDYQSEETYIIGSDDEVTSGSAELSITKDITDTESKYIITGSKKSSSFTASLGWSNITSDNVTENYAFQYTPESGSKVGITFSNKVNFKDNITVTELNDDNSIFINDYSQEDVSSLLQQIAQQVVIVNMQKIYNASQQMAEGSGNAGIIVQILSGE